MAERLNEWPEAPSRSSIPATATIVSFDDQEGRCVDCGKMLTPGVDNGLCARCKGALDGESPERIRNMYATGATGREIAMYLGVSESYVWQTLRRGVERGFAKHRPGRRTMHR